MGVQVAAATWTAADDERTVPGWRWGRCLGAVAFFTFLFLWQAAFGQYSAGGLSSYRPRLRVGPPTPREYGPANYATHPVREYQGTIYNFTEAIQWLASAPPDMPPGATNTTYFAEWERLKRRSDMAGARWKRFLLDGDVQQTTPVGIIVHSTYTVQERNGSMVVNHMTVPRYRTVTKVKQILLKNPPKDGVDLPIFAIPAGYTGVNGEVIESFDFGRPLVQPGSADSLASKPTSSRTRTRPPGLEASNTPDIGIPAEPGSEEPVSPVSPDAGAVTNLVSGTEAVKTAAGKVASLPKPVAAPKYKQTYPGGRAAQGRSDLAYEGREIRGIYRVSLAKNKVSLVWSGGGMAVEPEKLDEDFLHSWGIVKEEQDEPQPAATGPAKSATAK